MKYLISHYDTFYFRRKLNYKNICISLKTKNKLEAKFILATINAKLDALRLKMDIIEEVEYIKELLKEYVEVAKVEYSELATKREHKYTYTKDNGKILLGSHPKAIDYHIEELEDNLFSSNKKEIANNIINDSNIKEKYKKALKELSNEAQERLIDEVIKAEIELLYYDKSRNESRTNPTKLHNTYIDNSEILKYISLQDYHIKESIIDTKLLEEQNYKRKTKKEVFEEYFEEIKKDKVNMLDKVIPPIKTLFQTSENEYLIDYKLADYEIFFESLIYTPTYFSEGNKLYISYEGNYIDIAEDFKESIEGEENLLREFISSDKLHKRLQSIKNVEGKLIEINNFLDYCEVNEYIKKNYLRGNIKFDAKKFEGILKRTKKRKPFNDTELNLMFTKFNDYLGKGNIKIEEILIPVIALFSGMRVEEICKLKVYDIKQDTKTSIYYFDINGLLKTENSERKVPIHSQLINKFDFLEYVERRKANKCEMLFDLKSIFHKKKDKFSHYFLRDFFYDFRNSFVNEERIEEDLISFHSFRHTFATSIRAGGADLLTISNLLGHSVDTVAEVFFNIKIKENETPNYTKEGLKLLKKYIEKLEISDIQNGIDNFETIYKTFFSVTNK